MRALLFALLVGCTPSAQAITPAHPAHPDAEPGRLAGPPAALRPGVADVSTPPPTTTPATPATPAKDPHEGHTMPAPAPSTPLPDQLRPPTPSTPLPDELKPPAEAKPATKPAKKPAAKQPVPKKPAPTKDPHEGHQPAPAKPTPAKPPADPHQGHKGHGS